MREVKFEQKSSVYLLVLKCDYISFQNDHQQVLHIIYFNLQRIKYPSDIIEINFSKVKKIYYIAGYIMDTIIYPLDFEIYQDKINLYLQNC